MKQCPNCDKEPPQYMNYCDWECLVGHAKKEGGVVHCPNGLPIRCVTKDNLMIECEHGDHPDYMFPVEVEFTGAITADHRFDYKLMSGEEAADDEKVRLFQSETHALIYTDGSIALTMYECNYAIFSVHDGKIVRGPGWMKPQHKLSEASLKKIRERHGFDLARPGDDGARRSQGLDP